MRIAAITRWRSACDFYRLILPMQQLKRHSHDVTLYRGEPPAHLDSEYDIIVGLRVQDAVSAMMWEQWAKRDKVLLVNDIDDDIWNVHESNPGYEYCNDANHQRLAIRALSQSHIVTTTNATLREVLLKHNSNVHVLPNMIPQSILGEGLERTDSKCVIGWSGGASHCVDFEHNAIAISEALSTVAKSVDCELHTLGYTYDGVPYKGSILHRHDDWVGARDFYDRLDFHIALAPLHNTVFNQSKSDIRWLEAAAKCSAVIASDVQPYRNTTSLIVKQSSDWLTHLNDLTHDTALYDSTVRDGYARASQRTIECRYVDWCEVYGIETSQPLTA